MSFSKSACRGVLGVMVLLGCDRAAPAPASTTAAAPVARAVNAPMRALLIGIDDYSASRIKQKYAQSPADERGWPSLRGAVRDVDLLREMLIVRYGFRPEAIVTLRNQEATRGAILQAMEQHLFAPATKDSVLLFYYAGHGSQVENSLSKETDRRDESIIPADSRLGAPDIRDKELAVRFNRILDRKARLTIIFDSCHSGSVTRALPADSDVRALRMNTRDVRDPSNPPAPESRGALVMTASTDFARAYETEDQDGKRHGAFSWALLRAMRDSVREEAAADTFLRARAMMRADSPYQEPVIAGNPAAQSTPLLSSGAAAPRSMAVAVEKINPDGTVVLHGGWAHGLTVGTVLRVRDGDAVGVQIRVTGLLGLGRSEGRFLTSGTRAFRKALASGTLLDIVRWSAFPGRALRVWIPQTADVEAARAFVQQVREEVRRSHVRWIGDPTETTPSHVLRWRNGRWELVEPDGEAQRIQGSSFVRELPAGSSLFVHVPVPQELHRAIGVGPGSNYDSIEPQTNPRGADYVLVGRLSGTAVEYAWVRPAVHQEDASKTPLPPRTDWHSPEPLRDAAIILRRSILRLHTILAWHQLESPRDARSPYGLAFYDRGNDMPVSDATVRGGRRYKIRLQTNDPSASHIAPRYYYVFGIDSFGRSVLLFPLQAVENRFPVDRSAGLPPRSIEIAGFTATPPYGLDTYVLISTDEALPNPAILESSGVRTRGPRGGTALGELLSRTGGSTRSMEPESTSPIWSIDRVLIHSISNEGTAP
jgi:hypothetical protein